MKHEPVIVVKKKGHGHHGHHGGAWKVAYADFVTAMMAFFLVMWIVGQSADKKKAIAAWFRDPGAFETSAGAGLMPGAASGVTAEQDGASPLPDDLARARAALERAAEELRESLQQLPEFQDLADRVEIQVTAEGLRIEMMEGATDGFFEVGRSTLKPESVTLLGYIAAKVGRLPNKAAVEGHTDARAYHSTEVFSNWELSTDRANAARRVLEQKGLAPHQVEGVRGYADTRLRNPDDPFDARNRRITIVVRNLDLSTPGGPAAGEAGGRGAPHDEVAAPPR